MSPNLEWMKSIVQFVPIGVFQVDGDDRYIFVNPAWEKITGRSLAKSLGQDWWEVIHQNDREKVYRAWSEAESLSQELNIECQIISLNGSEKWVRLRTNFLFSDTGKTVFGSLEDITNKKKVDEEKEKLIQELKNAILLSNEAQEESSAKSEFIYRMSHELRTPMHAILGFSQLLETSKSIQDNSNDSASVVEVLKAGKHLLSLINNVLELSEIESRKIGFVVVSLFETVNNIMVSRHLLADSLKINIVNNIQNNHETRVTGDPKLIHQIVDALLTNSIKYNKEGGTVNINIEPAEDKTICLSVHNTGDPIPEENMEKIFEAFYRLEIHKNQIDGMGLGLTLAKKFTELMGGAISAQNQDKGCCFYLTLPKND
jgi:PAS domain S-box-containing protein